MNRFDGTLDCFLSLDQEKNFFFFRCELPIEFVLRTPGTVLRLSVWSQHTKTDNLVGECFIRLSTIECLKGTHGIRAMPVTEVFLRRAIENIQPQEFEVCFYLIDSFIFLYY